MDTWRRVGFLAGQFGLMCLVRFFLQWVIRFAKQPVEAANELGAATLFSGAAVGAALLAFRIFDGVTDPVAGVLGDGWVRRGHERRSLLWFAFALPAVGLLLSFAPHAHMGLALRWTLLLAGMFVFFVGYTLYAIPFWSLIEDYAQGSADERRTLSNLLGAGILLATAAAFVLSPALVQRWGFFRAAVAFALPSTAFMALPYFCAPRRAAGEHAPVRLRPARGGFAWSSVLEALRHRRFVAVVVLLGGSQMSFTVMTSAAPFIAERLLGGTDADVARLLGPFLATAIPFFCL
ncbi:MAG: MFS transporter, partial [Planctomycetota bacterium]